MSTPAGPGPPPTLFSPDGMWWWDGSEWKAAVSPDGLWRWNGQAWVPARPVRSGGGATAVVVTIAIFGGVLVLVSLLTIAVLYTMGNQIANVFSNVAAALGSSPSP